VSVRYSCIKDLSLIGVLLRFRERQVAIMNDAEGMFHQVRVSQKHRDVLKSLWWKDEDVRSQQEVYIMVVQLFGGICSTSCTNFALRRTAEDNVKDYSPEVVETVKRDIYVDDCLSSQYFRGEATDILDGMTSLVSKGGFHITLWCSSDKGVIKSISPSERAKEVNCLDRDRD